MNKTCIIFIAIAAVLLIIRIIAHKFFPKTQLFNDILKEKNSAGVYVYSQGRVYLLLSVLAYFVTIELLTSKAVKPNLNIDDNSISQIINALQWSIGLFAAYAFGGKGLDAIKLIMKGKSELPTKTTPAKNGNDEQPIEPLPPNQ